MVDRNVACISKRMIGTQSSQDRQKDLIRQANQNLEYNTRDL